jgi:hypothetical protein
LVILDFILHKYFPQEIFHLISHRLGHFEDTAPVNFLRVGLGQEDHQIIPAFIPVDRLQASPADIVAFRPEIPSSQITRRGKCGGR